MKYLHHFDLDSISNVIGRFGLELSLVESDCDIPYSYWGAPEAGRIINTIYARQDTPMHSLLHETCHFVCMSKSHHSNDSIDAGGGTEEENATCYLQLLLSDFVNGFSRAQHMQDMDDWGYSFRLGSAKAWFMQDAEDTKKWLQHHKIIQRDNCVSWKLRE